MFTTVDFSPTITDKVCPTPFYIHSNVCFEFELKMSATTASFTTTELFSYIHCYNKSYFLLYFWIFLAAFKLTIFFCPLTWELEFSYKQTEVIKDESKFI